LKQVVKEIGLPVFNIEMDYSECQFDTMDEIVTYLEDRVRSHKSAHYIGTFDHLKHTKGLPEGIVAEEITAAYNIIFCFGFSLQDAVQLAVRPRSIGICETGTRVTISFLEAPMPVANALMELWALSLLHDDEQASQSSSYTSHLDDTQVHT
jgi:hypothetical protein